VTKKLLLFATVMVVAVVMLAGQALADNAVPTTTTGTFNLVGDEYVLVVDEVTYRVDAGPLWYRTLKSLDLALLEGPGLSVLGEVGTGKDGAPEIDAFAVGGVTIREGAGRPPWAGGPNGRGGGAPDGVVDDD
jgi:hypothetical protein